MGSIPTRQEIQQVLEQRHGKDLQDKFAHACVAVCGLGGLGSHIALTLARVGIGRLILIDFDRVDLSNLHRQQYVLDQVGQYKTDALAQTLRKIAPYTDLVLHTLHLTRELVVPLLEEADVICEAFDDAHQKAMLANSVLELLPQKYLVAASGMAGLDSANKIQTRRVSSRFYLCGDGVSDVADGIGLVASRVMVCAAHQAHAVLRILAGQGDG